MQRASREVDGAFRAHRRLLWGLAYRMTGSTEDAEDVVQETFVRAVEHPPAAPGDLRPWLVHVAMNLARDALRRRKRRPYVGPWLPVPVETADLDELAAGTAMGTEARYDLRESATYAFLVALEALTPVQRAVLLLRDVLDYSVAEAAGALSITEGNVKVTHHRARRVMAAYDLARRPVDAALTAATREALERFLVAIASDDVVAAEACLTKDARAVSDGGGHYRAALRPVLGSNRVARFLLGLQKKVQQAGRFALRDVNGLPALLAEVDTRQERWAPRYVLRCDVAPDGRIRAVHIVLAPPKLGAIRPL
jgi:RNA polymerase sigma-70 factor (ECF subfamily)